MQKKKIIHIVHNLQIGGVETAVRSSVDKLNCEFDFWVISLHPNDENFVTEIANNNKLKCFNLHSIFFPINLIRLLVFLIKISPDLIISSLWKSHGVTLLLKLFKPKIKIISIIHSAAFRHRFDTFFIKQIIKKSVLVLCDSNSSKQFIERVTQNVRAEVLSFKINQSAETNEKSFHAHKIRAVFIGRLSKEKRIDRSIRLVNLLIKKGIDVTFDIYGPDNNKENELKKLIHDLGVEKQVKTHPAVPPDEVLTTLNKYDFMLQLSDVEGMAITVVQAMQQGLIPIVTRVGEMQYYVQHNKNGLIINAPFDELNNIANEIETLRQSPSKMQSMSNEAKQTFNAQPLYAEHLREIIKREIEPS